MFDFIFANQSTIVTVALLDRVKLIMNVPVVVLAAVPAGWRTRGDGAE